MAAGRRLGPDRLCTATLHDLAWLPVCCCCPLLQIMLTGLVIFSGIGTVCGGIIFQWRRSAANRKANMLKVCGP